MTDPQVALLMLGSFIFIILLGFPIAFTLMAMGVGFGYYAYFRPAQDFFDSIAGDVLCGVGGVYLGLEVKRWSGGAQGDGGYVFLYTGL